MSQELKNNVDNYVNGASLNQVRRRNVKNWNPRKADDLITFTGNDINIGSASVGDRPEVH